jgi:hypothetical protein
VTVCTLPAADSIARNSSLASRLRRWPQAVPPPHEHGSSGHWNKHYGCPDPACVAYASSERTAVRARHAARRVPDPATGRLVHPDLHPADSGLVPRHGTSTGRSNYLCECSPCTTWRNPAPVVPAQRTA